MEVVLSLSQMYRSFADLPLTNVQSVQQLFLKRLSNCKEWMNWQRFGCFYNCFGGYKNVRLLNALLKKQLKNKKTQCAFLDVFYDYEATFVLWIYSYLSLGLLWKVRSLKLSEDVDDKKLMCTGRKSRPKDRDTSHRANVWLVSLVDRSMMISNEKRASEQ